MRAVLIFRGRGWTICWEGEIAECCWGTTISEEISGRV